MSRKRIRIAIDKISTRERERLRPADPAKVTMMAVSMAKVGQLHDILIYPAPNEAKGAKSHVLSAGLHRLLGALENGETEIDATLITAEEAELIEVEENLSRADLTPLERAMFVNRRRELHAKMHGEPQRGGAQKAKISLWSETLSEIADRIGLGERMLKRADMIGRKLEPALRDQIRSSEAAQKESLLYRLAKMEPERQKKIAENVKAGQPLAIAIDATDPAPRKKPTDAQKRLQAALNSFAAMGAKERRSALQIVFRDRKSVV